METLLHPVLLVEPIRVNLPYLGMETGYAMQDNNIARIVNLPYLGMETKWAAL